MGRPHPSLIRHLGCWAIYAFCTIFCLIVTSGAHAAEAARPKRVLIISTGSRLAPGFALVDRGILEALGKIPSPPIETYAENLDILRFPTERFQRIFTEYLTEKYADQPPDLVILVYIGNFAFLFYFMPEVTP